jgi:hypothetical protein
MCVTVLVFFDPVSAPKTAKPSAAGANGFALVPLNLTVPPNPSHSIGRVVEMAVEQGESSPLSLLCEHRPVRPKKNSAC